MSNKTSDRLDENSTPLKTNIGSLQGSLADTSRPYDKDETEKALVVMANQIVERLSPDEIAEYERR